MTETPYPAELDASDQGGTPRLTGAALARALGISMETARAIASGEIPHCEVMTIWPSQGQVMIGSAWDLELWRQCKRDVDRFGIEAVRAAEDREQQQ